jgi:cellulose synthase/poly-beta-1,6-N-acetylglucosamine synthase-like glycosyltransferase
MTASRFMTGVILKIKQRHCSLLLHPKTRKYRICTWTLMLHSWIGMVLKILKIPKSKLLEPTTPYTYQPILVCSWSYKKRWAATIMVSLFTFISPLASSMMAPATPNIASEFGITNSAEAALVTSIFILAYGTCYPCIMLSILDRNFCDIAIGPLVRLSSHIQ